MYDVESKLIFELNVKGKTASIIGNNEACDVHIPYSIIEKEEEYKIISIKEGSFSNSKKIRSIHLDENSQIQRICTNAFSNSTIESLFLSNSVSYLEKGWCNGTPKLTEIVITPNNKHFIYLDDKMLVGKSDEMSDNYDVLIFVRRDIKEIKIPSFVKIIASYAFSESLIETIFIPSQITIICEGAFYQCNQLKKVEFSLNSELRIIEKKAFSNTFIDEIKIPSTVSELQEGWCDITTQIIKDNQVQYEMQIYYDALMLYRGDGTEMNKEEAFKKFKISADQGNSKARFYLALMLYNGDGIEMNKEESFKNFKIAADQGDDESMFYCGFMLQNGDGIEKNIEEAAKYYKLGSDRGNTNCIMKYEFIPIFKKMVENQEMFSSINKDISALKTLTTEQSKVIEEQKQRITQLENENQAKNQTNQKENQTMFSSINKDISSLKTLTTEQNKMIETQKQRITQLENKNQAKNQTNQKESQTMFSSINKDISSLKTLTTEQKRKITEIENENQSLSKQIKQITSSFSEQKLKNATKLEVSGNNINLVNDKGEVMSTIPIPSSIKQYSFESDSGHIQLANKLLIQWGRYTPSRWCSGNDRIKVVFPIPFATKPFMATGGGHGGNFHPSADRVTNESFITGYDNGDPTTWIAIGTI